MEVARTLKKRSSYESEENISGKSHKMPRGTVASTSHDQETGDLSVLRSAYTNTGDKMIYTKVHRMYSCGFGTAIIEHDVLSASQNTVKTYFVTTSLNEIPWDRPFFYLTPSEYDILPSTTQVTKVACDVTLKSTSQTFSSDHQNFISSNQNLSIKVAKGLNHYFNGMNVKIIDGTGPNKSLPNSISINSDDTHYKSFINHLYGVSQTNTSFNNIVPLSLFGLPICLNSYYALHVNNAELSQSGWPCLQNAVTYFHNPTTGQFVMNGVYKPKLGYLKKSQYPIRNTYHGRSDSAVVISSLSNLIPIGHSEIKRENSASNSFPIGHSEIKRENSASNLFPMGHSESEHENSASNTYVSGSTPTFKYTDLIEKSHLFYRRQDMSKLQSQPWIHVGVDPVPIVSVANAFNNTGPREYYDVQALFEITAEMTVKLNLAM